MAGRITAAIGAAISAGIWSGSVTVGEAQSDQFSALAQDVIDLADALRIHRFGVVGQDWGSPAGHAAAVLAPERVTWLVALATGYGPRPDDPELHLRQTHAFWYQWSVISTDGVDGLHLTAESERKLGVAIASKVKEILRNSRT